MLFWAAGWFFGLWMAFLAVWIAFALGAIPGFLVVIGAAALFVGYFIMRLVGFPGERIRISGGNVYADGRLLGEMDGIPSSINYVDRSGGTRWVGRDGEEYLVGEEEVFVLGDNSPTSFDSRYWGGVPVSTVHGRASWIYWPRDRAGRIGR